MAQTRTSEEDVDVELPEDADSYPGVTQPAGGSVAKRLLRLGGSLLHVHLLIAKQEVRKEQARLVGAVLMIFFGSILLLGMVLLAQVAAVVALHDYARLEWLWAVLITCGGDAVLGFAFWLIGAKQLRAPVLPQTRALAKQTFTSLRGE